MGKSWEFQKVQKIVLFQLHEEKYNKRHAMHAEVMTFHKGSLIIFRTIGKE